MKLTTRHEDVVRLVSIGLNNREIAEKLDISIKTVENHLREIYRSNNIKNRVMLAVEWHKYQQKLEVYDEDNVHNPADDLIN